MMNIDCDIVQVLNTQYTFSSAKLTVYMAHYMLGQCLGHSMSV